MLEENNKKFVDDLEHLEDLYNEFNKLVDNIDFNKHDNKSSFTLKELNEIESKIVKIRRYIHECLRIENIYEETTFFSLRKADDLLIDIYIIPHSLPIPMKENSLFEDHYQFRKNLDHLIDLLSNEINLILIYASKYAISYLKNEQNNLKVKLKSYGANIYTLQKSIDELNDKLSFNEEKTKNIENLETEIKNKVVIFTDEINQIKTTTIEDISNEKVRSVNNINDYSNKLIINLDNISKRISSDVEEDVKQQLSNTKKELNSIKDQSKDYQIKFEKLYELMKGMYGVAGDGKLADYNNKQANVEKASADKLRKDGIRWLSLPIIVTLGFVLHYIITGVELNIEWIITRFLTVSISASLAIYMLKESASHRSKENLYRQRGTQLATIGAYISDFPDEQEKMKLKTSLVNNFYSFHNGKADTSNVPDLNAQIKEIVTISKSLSKIIPTQHQDKSVTTTKEDKPQPTPSTRTLEKEQKETK